MTKIEVFGFVVEGTPFHAFPDWLALLTGLPVVVGVIIMCAAVFVSAPRELNNDETDDSSMRILNIGGITTGAGFALIVITIFTHPIVT